MRRRISLYIGGQLADLNDDAFVLFNYLRENLDNPTIVRNSWSQQVTLPGTPANNAIFGHIYRADRLTEYADGQTTGVYFDATQRTPFQLLNSTGELLEEGYLKLDDIGRTGNRVTYTVTLYGGLGGFLYALSYDEDGNRRTLADIKYTGESALVTELDITIGRDAVLAAWNRITGNGTASKYDYINFAPCYDGLPQGYFDANKALARPSLVGLPVPTGYRSQDGWTLVTLPSKHTAIEMRDLRSYLQRPLLRVQKLIQALCKTWNNGGYTVELDSTFFNTDNPYYAKTWITLPQLDTLKLTIADDTYNYESVRASSSETDLSGGGVSAAKYLVSFDVVPFITGSVSGQSFWYMHGEVDGTYVQNWLTYKIDLLAGSTLLDTQTIRISSAPSQYATVPEIDIVGAFSPQSGGTRADFGPQNVVTTLQGYGATAVRITVTPGSATWGEPAQADYSNSVFSGSTVITVGTGYVERWTERRINSEVTRTGTVITKQMLLSGGKTPADYLLSYCKLFGLVLTFDRIAKKVGIMRRSSFYLGSSPIIDLTARVDVGKGYSTRPFAFDSRWYEFGLDEVPSEFVEYYKTVYGRKYGAQRVNTGFAFNADTKDLLDGNAYRDAAEVLEISKYFVSFTDPVTGVNIPSVFLDTGGTYSLLNATTRQAESLAMPGVPTSANVVYWNPNTPGYDFTSRLQCHGDDNAPVDGRDVLVFYDGYDNPQVYAPGLSLTDDTPEMVYQNGNKPCWLLNYGDYVSSRKVTRLPRFHRYITTRDGDATSVVYSLDMGVPAELRLPSVAYQEAASIYGRYWAAYIGDRYDDDSKVMTCWVNLAGLQVGPELLRRFFYFDGALWSLNKIINYSLTTFDDTQCEFVKVQDVDNYTAAAPVVTYYLRADRIRINVNNSGTTEGVLIESNVSWIAATLATWITVTPVSGTGNGTIALQITENTSGSERTGTVKLATSQAGVPDVTITVHQSAAVSHYLSISPEQIAFPANPTGPVAVQVNSDIAWYVEQIDDYPWLSAAPLSGSGDGVIYVTAEANNTGSSRIGTIYVSSDLVPGMSVDITQPSDSPEPPPTPTGSVWMRDPNQPGIIPTKTIYAESTGFNAQIGATGPWRIVSDVPWLHQYNSSLQEWTGPATESSTIYIGANENTTGAQRVGHLVISLIDDPTVNQTFTVTQMA
jgi:hypothetical protein